MKQYIKIFMIIGALGIAGCSDEDGNESGESDPVGDTSGDFVVGCPDTLLWKRVDVLEADVAAALELDRSSMCIELGTTPCRDGLLTSLGGNDPFGLGLYEPMDQPLATTPAATERLVLAACAVRRDLDAEGDPVVFTALDWGADTVAKGAQLDQQVEILFERFLARRATAEEIDAVTSLADEPTTPGDFAAAACFAIGSTTEFMTI